MAGTHMRRSGKKSARADNKSAGRGEFVLRSRRAGALEPHWPARCSKWAYSKRGTVMRIGFIGLGRMGTGMAMNLLKAGHDVAVYNRTREKAQALVAQGAHAATTVAEACRGDVVITMLADDAAVEGVALVSDGVIASLRA